MSNSDESIKLIHEQLKRLEAQNRRLRWGVASIVLLLAAAILTTCQMNAGGSVVEAERFVLRDQEGHIRAALETVNRGTQLTVYGGSGLDSPTRIKLGVVDSAAQIGMYDETGGQLDLLLGSKEGPAVSLMDPDIGGQMILVDFKSGQPRILVRERDQPGAIVTASGSHAELTPRGLSVVK